MKTTVHLWSHLAQFSQCALMVTSRSVLTMCTYGHISLSSHNVHLWSHLAQFSQCALMVTSRSVLTMCTYGHISLSSHNVHLWSHLAQFSQCALMVTSRSVLTMCTYGHISLSSHNVHLWSHLAQFSQCALMVTSRSVLTMCTYGHISLSSHNEKCLRQICRKNQRHFSYSITLFFGHFALYDIMLKNTVEPDRSQTTTRLTCIACWITKATNTLSEYVIPISFPPEKWLHKIASLLPYTQ